MSIAARRVVLEITSLKLTDVVRKTLSTFDWSDDPSQRIVLDAELLEDIMLKKDLMVHADEHLVTAALHALLTSSRNALPVGSGTLRVRTGKMRCPKSFLMSDHVFFGAERPEGNYAYVEIFDTGTGLSEEARRDLFSGTDLNLKNARRNCMEPVRRLAQTHPCAVEIQSRTQRGMTTRLLFSLAHSESGRRRKVDPR